MRLQPLPFALLAALAAAGLPGCSSTDASGPPAPSFTVKVIGFNDYHGHLQSPGSFGVNAAVPAASRPAVGGADYLAAYVEKLKASQPLNVVVGAGDFIGASPLVSALFHDEPAVETLNHIGVEFNAVGNHEFDKGRAELLRLQNGGCKLVNGAADPNSCRGLGSARPGGFDGAKFQWLSANVVDTASGRTLLPAYGIKTFNGVQVAFIGMTLKGTPGIVSPAGVAGLEFRDEADTVNALVPGLRAQGIEAIVVLVHQGGMQGGGLGDINGCVGDLRNADGSDSELGKIVRRLDDAVDLVVSGHTHAAYNCSANTVDVIGTAAAPVSTPRATGLPNAAGRLVPATSAGALGRVLTDIDITIDPNRRDIVAVSPRNVLVDRTDPAITASALLKRVVDGYAALVAPVSAQVVGHVARAMPATANAAGEMPAGDLIADAQLAATQPAAQGGAEIAFMNPGGVRSPGFDISGAAYPYAVSYGDAFTVQPFGNTLMTLNLTAQQLKNLLEQQFAGCQGQATTRLLQVSNGFKFTWKASAPACAKVTDVRLTRMDLNATPPVALAAEEVIVANGLVLAPSKLYRITVNNFIQSGGDGFTVLAGGTNVLGGGQDIDALVGYLGKFKAPRGAYEPAEVEFNIPRITLVP
ncbi:bifunctional metallophosphatase/5'-nucleotidase [Azohydromonas australica]|uniref:bifunctional metallophosphatase/5'-nucleotidase n=1 Tax=Azohydromonas australica TaxID=364039 RepID=UPI00041B0F48|nr:bifunctional metallophosphatase/5'-nucleotidase [Azohydromonas australica]